MTNQQAIRHMGSPDLEVIEHALEVHGSYAEAVAALESWHHGILVSAGGGSYRAIYCCAPEDMPSVLSHADSRRHAPMLVTIAHRGAAPQHWAQDPSGHRRGGSRVIRVQRPAEVQS